MSQYFPPYNNSDENIKVELDLGNYATKKDIKDIIHVDISSYALKTNLAALKTEVDKIDTDKLKTVPDDLAKLSNVVKNDFVKKTEYNRLKNKVDAINTSGFVTRTKFTTDTNALDDKTDKVENKIPDIASLATKSSVTYLITEAENKIDKIDKKIPDISRLATKTALTAVENKIPDVTGFVKQSDYATEITSIKNDYATNASLDSKINDLKAQNIADEVKKVDDKVKKNARDNLGFELRLKQKEHIVDDLQRDNALTNRRDYYRDKMYLVYECKTYSFKYDGNNVNLWKLTGINNYPKNSNMNGISVNTLDFPVLVDNRRMNVKFDGAYFKQTKLIKPNNDIVINIYCVYSLEPINNLRNTDYTVQNALFGGVKITKDSTDTSKHKYEGYGICFDEGGSFSMGNINNGRNAIIFGVHENSVIHSNNKTNNIYIMGDGFVQGIVDTTLYTEKNYSQNFTAPNKKFVLSLHYNGDNSYLFVNGK